MQFKTWAERDEEYDRRNRAYKRGQQRAQARWKGYEDGCATCLAPALRSIRALDRLYLRTVEVLPLPTEE